VTALERIEAFLRQNTGRAYCDDCLSALLHITPRQQVQQKTSQLARDNRFWRQRGPCAEHGNDEKIVIRMRTSASSILLQRASLWGGAADLFEARSPCSRPEWNSASGRDGRTA
jgi:hypothetical protein